MLNSINNHHWIQHNWIFSIEETTFSDAEFIVEAKADRPIDAIDDSRENEVFNENFMSSYGKKLLMWLVVIHLY